MPARLPLGNDIVDLRLAENQNSASNRRYLERVLAAQERIAPSHATIDHRVFWAFWAAKEAAYKALKKNDPGLVLAHDRFVVRPATPVALTGHQGNAQGVVRHDTLCVAVSWIWNDDWMHCLTGHDHNRSRYRVLRLADCTQGAAFRDMKKTSSLRDASIAVRLLALSLLADCGIDDVQIVRESDGRRQGPPRVLQHGREMNNVDISLSHDGRYVAAAVRVGITAVP